MAIVETHKERVEARVGGPAQPRAGVCKGNPVLPQATRQHGVAPRGLADAPGPGEGGAGVGWI
jgi:hypothetical protein